MKKIHLILLVLFFVNIELKSQTSIIYTYDAGGNMVQRQIQVMPPLNARFNNYKDSTEIFPALNFKIYPNPTNQYVNIEGDLPENINEAKLEIMTSTGQILKTDVYQGQKKTLDVSGLKSGLYLLEIIYSKKKRSTYKIIITN